MNRLCAALLVTLVGVSGAWGQDHSSPVDLPNGCTILEQQFHGPLSVYQTEGRCKDGLADGVWLLGTSAVSSRGERVKVVRFSGRLKGRVNGFSLSISEFGARVVVSDPDFNGFRYWVGDQSVKYDAPESEFQRLIAQLDEANGVARSFKLAVVDTTRAKALLRQWRRNPAAFFDQYLTGVATTPPWANGMSQSTSRASTQAATTSNSADDPKARGRSARGG